MTKQLILVLGMAACVTEPEPEAALNTSDTELASKLACPEGVPAAIAPATDQDLALVTYAVGVQKYTCNAAGAWTFVAPDADVWRDGHWVIHHYVGPSWKWKDGSAVVGARLAGATVDPTAIPWLLLGVTSHGSIPGKLDNITSIQRVTTTGGNAPAGVCTPATNIDVPYTAGYLFYRTNTHKPEHNTRCGAL
jgi:hypothetical protein